MCDQPSLIHNCFRFDSTEEKWRKSKNLINIVPSDDGLNPTKQIQFSWTDDRFNVWNKLASQYENNRVHLILALQKE